MTIPGTKCLQLGSLKIGSEMECCMQKKYFRTILERDTCQDMKKLGLTEAEADP